MKNRIIALILVVVMSVLTLSSCGSYDFTKEDLSAYASFKGDVTLDDFFKALLKLKIEEDGLISFTANEETREKLVKSAIYDAIVKKVIEATEEADRITDFEENPLDVNSGDVLYFVYYVTVAGKNGEPVELYRSEMDPSKVTGTSSLIPHMLKLALHLDDEDDSFLIKLKEALEKETFKPYLTKNATQLKAEAKELFEKENGTVDECRTKAEDALKQKHVAEGKEEPTSEELKKAGDDAVEQYNKDLAAKQEEAIEVKDGQKVVISFTRTHEVPKIDEETGEQVKDENDVLQYDKITETVNYYNEVIDKNNNPLHAFFFEDGAVADIGGDFKKVTERNDDGSAKTTSKEFEVTIDGVKYNYESLKFHWVVEDEGIAIPIEHVLYELEDYATKNEETGEYEREKDENGEYKTKKEVTVDGLNQNGEKIDLIGQTLTYHVLPVYAVDAPSYEEMKAENAVDLLFYIYGSGLDAEDFDVLGEDYKFTYTEKNEETGEDEEKEVSVKDLLEEITKIFIKNETKVTDDELKENTYYYVKGENDELEATPLKLLLDAYKKANTDANGATSDVKYQTAQDALDDLNDARNEILKPIIEKIANAKKGEDVLGLKALDEYYKTQYDSKESTYEEELQKKINQAVWDKIEEFVAVDEDKIPEKLIKEFRDQIYEYHKYEFYVGPTSSESAARHFDTYKGSFDAYLVAKGGLGLKTGFTKEKLEEALREAAIADIVPLVKIYFIAKAINDNNGVETLKNYVANDIENKYYKLTNEEIEFIKETYPNPDEVIAEREGRIEETENSVKDEANYFLIDEAFMNMYKKEVGNVQYNQNIDQYGEINLRARFQINKLFYYLTSPYYVWDETDGECDVRYTEVDENGDKFIDFKTVEYTIVDKE